MNHADVRSRLPEYLEGDLSLDRRALVDAHLDGCDSCTAELDELRTTIHLLRSLPDVEPPPQLVADVMRRIRLGEATPSLVERFREFASELFAPGVAIPAGAMVIAFAMALSTGKFQASTPFSVAGVAPAAERTAAAQLPVIPREAQVLATEAFGGQAARGREPSAFRGSSSPLTETRPPAVFEVTTVSTDGASTGAPRVRVVARPRPGHALSDSFAGAPRTVDEWLVVVRQKPAEFASRQASLSLAEREHWVRALAQRAVEQGTAEEVVRALRNGGTSASVAFARSLAAEAQVVAEQIATSR
ncbi:MAG: zf-HC2 domain-containing protein [Myxococcales bacterium]|nr:zf-HC2 domain-containing protein [Myxococcales bacterium]